MQLFMETFHWALILTIPFLVLECLFESFLSDATFWSKLSILSYILPIIFLNFLVHIVFIVIVPNIFTVIKQNYYFFIIPIAGLSFLLSIIFLAMFLILFCLVILIQCNILCIKTMASLDSVIFHRRLIPNSGSQPKWEQVSLIQVGI